MTETPNTAGEPAPTPAAAEPVVRVRIGATATDGAGRALETVDQVLEFPRAQWDAWTAEERSEACAEAAWDAANDRTSVDWEVLPPPPPPPARVTVVWSITETHMATVDFDELFDEAVERGIIEADAPRTLEPLRERAAELEGWAADREDSDTYSATTERDVIKVRAAR